jgi:hypothetical protein
MPHGLGGIIARPAGRMTVFSRAEFTPNSASSKLVAAGRAHTRVSYLRSDKIIGAVEMSGIRRDMPNDD